jgi:hypothetical protein
MIFWLERRFLCLVMACLVTAALEASAAAYRRWDDEYGRSRASAVIEQGDTLSSIASNLASRATKPLTDEQMALLMRELATQNHIDGLHDSSEQAARGIPVGRILDIKSADKLMDFFNIVNQSVILASSRIEVPHLRPIDVDFVRDAGFPSPALALVDPGRILVNMKAVKSYIGYIRERAQDPKCLYYRLYTDKNDTYVLTRFVEGVVYHEYIHNMTSFLIRSPAFQKRLAELTRDRVGNPQSIVDEMAAFLGEIYFREDPRPTLDMILNGASQPDTGHLGHYASAYRIIISKFADKYGIGNRISQIEAEKLGRPLTENERVEFEEKYAQGEYFRNAVGLNLIAQELRKVPDDRKQKDSREIFRTLFGMNLPDRKYFAIPDAAFTDNGTIESDLSADLSSMGKGLLPSNETVHAPVQPFALSPVGKSETSFSRPNILSPNEKPASASRLNKAVHPPAMTYWKETFVLLAVFSFYVTRLINNRLKQVPASERVTSGTLQAPKHFQGPIPNAAQALKELTQAISARRFVSADVRFVTNETQKDAVLKELIQADGKGSGILIGATGLLNLSIAVARRSQGLVIVDINRNTRLFWDRVREVILSPATTRRNFMPDLLEKLKADPVLGSRTINPEISQTSVERMTQETGSWLASDETFAFVQGLFMGGLVTAVVMDWLDPQNVRILSEQMRKNGLRVDTLYISSIWEAVTGTGNVNDTGYPEGRRENGPVLADHLRNFIDDRTFLVESRGLLRTRLVVRHGADFRKKGLDSVVRGSPDPAPCADRRSPGSPIN